jgi:hypothetical protein
MRCGTIAATIAHSFADEAAAALRKTGAVAAQPDYCWELLYSAIPTKPRLSGRFTRTRLLFQRIKTVSKPCQNPIQCITWGCPSIEAEILHVVEKIEKTRKEWTVWRGLHAPCKGKYRDQQIDCRDYAYKHGMDSRAMAGAAVLTKIELNQFNSREARLLRAARSQVYLKLIRLYDLVQHLP